MINSKLKICENIMNLITDATVCNEEITVSTKTCNKWYLSYCDNILGKNNPCSGKDRQLTSCFKSNLTDCRKAVCVDVLEC